MYRKNTIIGVLALIALALGAYALLVDRDDAAPLNGENEPVMRTVQLYYYNEPQGEIDSVDRTLPDTENIVEDTINLLIKGELTSAEKSAGFTTEFPNPDFRLVSSNLSNGVLTLEFTQVPGFTTGGSARVTILSSQVIETAKQFDEVDEVRLMPEEIFQP